MEHSDEREGDLGIQRQIQAQLAQNDQDYYSLLAEKHSVMLLFIDHKVI
jgi:hypothetical protein